MTIEKSRLIRRRGYINADEIARVDMALKLSLNLLGER
jgi:mRNA interferase MazF